MYALADYVAMADDAPRVAAYLAALKAAVRPGDHVADVGAGFGFFAVAAARLGAARVYAIEPNDAIDHGPRLAAQHGVADRIVFLQGRADAFRPERPVDVLIEDLRGALPTHGRRLDQLADLAGTWTSAATRWLTVRDRLMVVPCDVPADDQRAEGGDADPIGPDLSAVRQVARATWSRVAAADLAPLGPAVPCITVVPGTTRSRDVRGRARTNVVRDGAIDALGVWCDAELAGGAGFSSGPGTAPSIHGCVRFPLPAPLPVRAGDEVEMTLALMPDGVDGIWRWRAEVRRDGAIMAAADATDLAARLLSTTRRARRAPGHVPQAGMRLALERALLEAIDGRASLQEIAATVHARFPGRFADAAAALAWVAEAAALLDDAEPR